MPQTARASIARALSQASARPLLRGETRLDFASRLMLYAATFRIPPFMDLSPFTLAHVAPFLSRVASTPRIDEALVLEVGRRMPAAATEDSLYVDVGGNPAAMHALARLGGYRAVVSVRAADARASESDVTISEGSLPSETFRYRVQSVDFDRAPLPFGEGSVEVITCLDALPADEAAASRLFGEFNRVLKEGGHLLAAAPNAAAWANVLEASSPEQLTELRSPVAPMRQASGYTAQALRLLMRAAGFEGAVLTVNVGPAPDAAAVRAQVEAGFTDFDRGDTSLVVVRKAGAPVVQAAQRAGGR